MPRPPRRRVDRLTRTTRHVGRGRRRRPLRMPRPSALRRSAARPRDCAGVCWRQPRCFAAMTATSPDMLLAFAAGLLSVLSPCVLPLLPAYLSLISGISVEEMQEGGADGGVRARVMRACLGFVARLLRRLRADGRRRGGGRATCCARGAPACSALEFGVSQIAGVVIVAARPAHDGHQPDPRAVSRHALPVPHGPAQLRELVRWSARASRSAGRPASGRSSRRS